MNVLKRQYEPQPSSSPCRSLTRMAGGIALLTSLSVTAASAQVVEYFINSGDPTAASESFELGFAMTGNNVGPLDAYSIRLQFDPDYVSEVLSVDTVQVGPTPFNFGATDFTDPIADGMFNYVNVSGVHDGEILNPNNGHFITVTLQRTALPAADFNDLSLTAMANPDAVDGAFLSGGDSTPIPAPVEFVPPVDPDTAVVEYYVDGDASLPGNLVNIVVDLTENNLDIGGYAFTIEYDPATITLAGDAVVPAGSAIQTEELNTTNVGPDSGRVNVAGLISLPENTAATGGLFVIPFTTTATPDPLDIYGIPVSLTVDDNPDVVDSLITFGAENDLIPHIFRRVAVVDPELPTPINPTPANGAVDQPLEVAASWELDDDQYPGASFEVFLWEAGDSKPANPTIETDSMSVTFENLDTFTTYHWQVANVFGALSSESAVWEFTTSVDPDTAVVEYHVSGDASLPDNLFNVVVDLTNNDLDIGGYAFTFEYDPANLTLAGDAVVPAGSAIQTEELNTTNVGPDSGRVNVAGLISLPENTAATGGLFVIPFMTSGTPEAVDANGIPVSLVLDDNPDVVDTLITFGAENELIPHVFLRVPGVVPELPTPINPTPANGAVDQPLEVAASWELDDDQYPGASFEVFLWEAGDSKPANPTIETDSMSVTFENLDTFTTYHWQVANVFGPLSSESAVWQFTTAVDPDTAVVEYHVSGDASLPNNLFNVVVDLTNNDLDIGGYAFTFEYDPANLTLAGDAVVPAGSAIQTEELNTTNVGPDSGRVNVAGLISLPENTAATGGLFVIPFMTSGTPEAVDATGIPVSLILDDNPDVVDTLITFGADNELIPHVFLRVPGVVPELPTPINPTPADGAVDQPLEVAASWELDDDQYPGASFEVFLWEAGDSKPANPTFETDSMSVTFENLDAFTTYNWQVANVFGPLSSESAVWQFTTSVDPDTAVVEYHVSGDASLPNNLFNVVVDLTNNDLDIGGYAFTFEYDPANMALAGDAVVPAGSAIQTEELNTTNVGPDSGRVNVAGLISLPENTAATGGLFVIPFMTSGTPEAVDANGIPVSLVLDDNPDVVDTLITFGADNELIPHVFLRVPGVVPELPTPINPTPADGAVDQPLEVAASWELDDDQVPGASFEVFLWEAGDSKPADPTFETDSMSVTFENLDPFTTYNWQVANVFGALSSESAVWEFTTSVDPDTAVVEYFVVGDASAADATFNVVVELTNNDLDIGGYAFTFEYDPANLTLAGDAEVLAGSAIQTEELNTTNVGPDSGRVNVAGLISLPENTGSTGVLFSIPFTTSATPEAVDANGIPVSLVLDDNPDVVDTLITFGADNELIPHIFLRVPGVILDVPGAPVSPNPADGAINVAVHTPLSWEAGMGGAPDNYDVFLWEDGTPMPATPTATVTDTSFVPGPLATETTYLWEVRANNLAGSATSNTWSFTTAFNEETAIIAYTVLGDPTTPGTTISLIASLQDNVYDIGGFAFSAFFDPSELVPVGNLRPVPGSNFSEYDQLTYHVDEANNRVNIAALISDEDLTAATGGLFLFDFETTSTLTVDGFGIPENLILGDNPDVTDNLITFGAVNDIIGHLFERRGAPPAEIQLDPTEIAVSTPLGTNAPSTSFSVANVGMGEDLNFEVAASESWIVLPTTTGTVAAGDDVDVDVDFDTAALEVGTYEATITVSDSTAINSPQTVEVTLVVEGGAIIALDPTAIDRVIEFGENAAPEIVTLSNVGSEALNYTISILDGGESWINVAPTTGTLAADDATTFTVSFDTATVPEGNYAARVRVSDPDAINDPQDIDVTLQVIDNRAVIAVDPAALNPVVLVENDADPDSFTVTNNGVDALNYTVAVDQPWLSVAPTTGTLGSGDFDFIDVTYMTAGLDVGDYTANITVSDPAAANSPQVVVVNLSVLGPEPIIAFDPESIEVDADYNVNPAPVDFRILNAGLDPGSVMDYELSTDAAWIDVSPTTGTLTADGVSSDTITLTFDIVGVEPGTYTANVIAESDDAQNSPAFLPVTITINETRALIALDPELIELSIQEGTNAEPTSVTLTNVGLSPLNYSVSLTGDAPETWIDVSPTTGTLAPDASDILDLVFNTVDVPPGTYSAELVVSDPGAGNSPQSVLITLEVLTDRASIIALSRDTLNVDAAQDAAIDPVDFTIANEGDLELNFTNSISFAEVVDPWLFVAPESGMVPIDGDIEAELTFDITGLEPGLYGAVVTVSDPMAENDPQTIVVSLRVIQTSFEFTFADDTQGWIFENESPPFEEAFGEHNAELGRLEITTQDNENTFAYWRTDPDDPIQIAAPGVTEAFKSSIVLAGALGDDSLFRTSWTVYSDTPTSQTPIVRLRVSSLDWAITHKLGFSSVDDHALSADPDGIEYVQYFAQPGHIDQFSLFFDVANFEQWGAPDATVGLERVVIESLGTASLGDGTQAVSYNFIDDTNGFTFRDAMPFIDAATGFGPEPGAPNDLGLEIFGGDFDNGAPPVLFGYWGHESGVPIPGNSLVRLTFNVGSDVPEASQTELPTIRLRLNDGSLKFSALYIVHPAGGAPVPNEERPLTYTMWVATPAELDGEEMILSFDYLSTPGQGPVNPFWSVGLLDLDVTVYDLP